jgi:hypothetical protein
MPKVRYAVAQGAAYRGWAPLDLRNRYSPQTPLTGLESWSTWFALSEAGNYQI